MKQLRFSFLVMKRCPQCGETKPLSEFSQQKHRVNSWCKACFAAYTKARRDAEPEKYLEIARRWRAANRDKAILSSKQSRRKAQYGMNIQELDALLASQNHRCLVCLEHIELMGTGRGVVDHDHVTGRVRGILCSNCNLGIGNLRESIPNLSRAIDYLEAAQGTSLKVV